ncbi:Disease resistance protein [Camellia lanceoleosa]|uniref:Disease resistance protein n=1 Tax=Camellia lanceoleosa TaxID=1840588 RepID=A0ACC0G7V8_9ERIC|nr:Disease resistance protein [Camellia lanceoleosa]
MNGVMEALTDDSIYVIGICGMGGVGKTTMVKEVAKKAEEKKMFDKIMMSRGTRIKILTAGRILVILDDVWKRLGLNDIGIPCGDHYKGCKIVMTSRSEDVCIGMDRDKNFKVGVLSEKEAWNLFKEMAGISNGSTSHPTDLQLTQMAVVKECGGLLIAIVTVWRALRCKRKPSWDSALEQMRKSMVKNITEVGEKVFKPPKLSYNYLETQRIYPGVLSSLLKLEELYVGTTFQQCCKVEESKEGAKAIIDELASLSNLVALDIALVNITFWPRGLVVEKVKKFNIVVGVTDFDYILDPCYSLSNLLELQVQNVSDIIETSLNLLLKGTEILDVNSRTKGLKILCDLVDEDGFECLTKLSL